MLIRSAAAIAAIAAALVATAPTAKADIGMMMAHNYEMMMPGLTKGHADRNRQVSVQQVIRSLSRRGYHDFRVLKSSRGIYRILAHRKGRSFVVRAARRDGRILSVNRG